MFYKIKYFYIITFNIFMVFHNILFNCIFHNILLHLGFSLFLAIMKK